MLKSVFFSNEFIWIWIKLNEEFGTHYFAWVSLCEEFRGELAKIGDLGENSSQLLIAHIGEIEILGIVSRVEITLNCSVILVDSVDEVNPSM